MSCPALEQAAKKQALARGQEVTMVETDWRWWSQEWADRNPYKVGSPSVRCSSQLVGGFAGRMRLPRAQGAGATLG